ncbi:MAG: TIGR04282 family arsenosugar biosynthesis glycosyltransferase [Alphaproteobacteria bacterium]|nr:TIGR04282 family arsenosugar biosynthesis glycosyltransferase [Alphaproteobacteria bacterium]
MNGARQLVVFVKLPRLGAVKRRLAAGIGDVAAYRFYRETTASLLRRVGRDPRWRTWLAVTPDRSLSEDCAWPADLPRLPQGQGDLGRRMGRILRHLPPGPAVIIGSDIPAIGAAQVAAAFATLGRCDAVFGPSPDGGYWLVGFRRCPIGFDPFAGVRWSSPAALADTRANLDKRFSVTLLDELEDVDDVDSYLRWRRRAATIT